MKQKLLQHRAHTYQLLLTLSTPRFVKVIAALVNRKLMHHATELLRKELSPSLVKSQSWSQSAAKVTGKLKRTQKEDHRRHPFVKLITMTVDLDQVQIASLFLNAQLVMQSKASFMMAHTLMLQDLVLVLVAEIVGTENKLVLDTECFYKYLIILKITLYPNF